VKKILVVSDSHGNYTRLNKIIKKEYPFDYIVHCGDGVTDLFQAEVPSDAKVLRVTGNVDLGRGLDLERVQIEEINGKRIMVTHGDIFSVQNGFDMLINQGKREGADIIFFGHTHIEYLFGNSPVLFNPGAANHGQYGVVTIGDDVVFSHGVIEG